MKIAFLLGSPDISGGTYVIFEHAARLNRMGHAVTIITENPVDEKAYSWHPAAGDLVWSTFAGLAQECFDMTIATWWQSVFQLGRVNSRKYLYFVQSIESRFFEEKDADDPGLRDVDILSQWCENTYSMGLPVITEARWIKNYLWDHYNQDAFLVRNGIRKDIYHEEGPAISPRQPGLLRVLVEGPLGVFFKNVEKTIELCLQAEVAEIWLLTSSAISDYPGVNRCFSRVPVLQTAEIYRSCDILVKLSYVEGMFGPPLEMFHCGGTALVYDVTGHDEYIRHGENSLVVQRDNEGEVVELLKKLKTDAALLASLQEGARKTASAWPGWDEVANQFSVALETCHRDLPDMSARYMLTGSNRLLEIRDHGLRAREFTRFVEKERVGGNLSISFANHIQVYWDCGRGIEAVLTDSYNTGVWSRCSVVVPSAVAPKVLRIDPSVNMGIVEIRELQVVGRDSGKTFARWREGGSWQEIAVAGTACVLRMAPYPILEAYGEDPQLFLPSLPNLPDNEWLRIDIEVRAWSFAQAMTYFGGMDTRQDRPGLGWGGLFGRKVWRKVRSALKQID